MPADDLFNRLLEVALTTNEGYASLLALIAVIMGAAVRRINTAIKASQAAEAKATKARLDAQDAVLLAQQEQMDSRFAGMSEKYSRRFDSLEEKLDRVAEATARLEGKIL